MYEDRFISDLEVRSADGDGPRVIAGTAITYNERSTIAGRFTEEFAPNSLVLPDTLKLVLMHRDREVVARAPISLSITDTPERMTFEARPPLDVPEARAAVSGTDAGLYRGASLRFDQVEDRWTGLHRRILKARVLHLSIVDDPGHDSSVIESRWKAQAQPYPPWRVLLWLA